MTADRARSSPRAPRTSPRGRCAAAVLEGARRFKAAWVEFGRLLARVRSRGSLWKEWGYPSFDRYCAKELFIRRRPRRSSRRASASWSGTSRSSRAAQADAKAPPFEVIEVLSRAEAAGRLSHAGWRELRDEVLERSAHAGGA